MSESQTSNSERPWYKKKRWNIPLGILVFLIFLGALAPDEEEDGEEVADTSDEPTEEEEPEPEPESTPEEEPTEEEEVEPEPEPEPTTAEEEEEAPQLRSEITMLDPPDEGGFLDGLRLREPERMVEFDNAELVELGEVGCNMTEGYIPGSEPTPTGELVEAMIDRGHDMDLAQRIAPDIRNAAEGTICESDVTEQT